MSAFKPKVMFIFPGQGSQYQGMGSDLYAEFVAARKVYQEAGDVLGYDIAELSFRDPEGKLDTTVHTQPAILTHALACMEVFRELTDGRVEAAVAGGHSLGEYAALVAAGVLSLPDALALVKHRGELLSEHGRGLMAALPLDAETVRAIAPRFYCEIGGCNVPDQTVVGGSEEDLKALVDYVKEQFNARATLLNVEGAFHTYLMVAAAEQFRPCLDAANFAPPRFDVLSNYSGAYHPADGYAIKANLFFQIFNPVRWIWGMQHALRDGANLIFEFGGGIGKGEGPAAKRPNLAGITKKALKSVERHAVYAPAINSDTIKKAAALAASLGGITMDPRDAADDSTHAGAGLRLCIPVVNGIMTDDCIPLLETVGASGLTDELQLIAQSERQNVEDLYVLGEQDPGKAQPYLVKVSASGAPEGAPFIGKPLEEELHRLEDARRRR